MSAGNRVSNLRLTDAERVAQQRAAKRAGVSWAAWARHALREAQERQAHDSVVLLRATVGREAKDFEAARLAKMLTEKEQCK